MQGPFIDRRTFWQRVKELFAPVLVALVALGKSLGALLPFLKVGGSMIIYLAIYAMFYGWKFAAGFVLLIFIHEMGHLIAARIMGLKVGLPVFIPFMGAVIALREAPRNAWIESVVGIGGPILGSIGALAVASCYYIDENQIFLVLGYTGFLLNLFNLIPMVPLDGGRIVAAISPWFWIVGLAILLPLFIMMHNLFSIIVLFIVILSLPRVIALFRRRKDPEQLRYFECTAAQRTLMCILYFGLIIGLCFGMGRLQGFLPAVAR